MQPSWLLTAKIRTVLFRIHAASRLKRLNSYDMRILLSEGASTSARQAITALGLNGHDLEVCDPSPLCLGRFSRFVSRFHRCPALGNDPQGYLSFVIDLISGRRFDVLLPIHEQGFLFARVPEQIMSHVAVALPSFESYARPHSKDGFSRLASELNLPQPTTQFVATAEELHRIETFLRERSAPRAGQPG